MKLELLRRKFKSCFSSSPHLNVIRGKVERFQNKKGSELLRTNGLGKQGFSFGFLDAIVLLAPIPVSWMVKFQVVSTLSVLTGLIAVARRQY